MHKRLFRCGFAAVSALVFAAGCSSTSPSVAPVQSSLTPSNQESAPGMRVLAGPAVSGPIVVSLSPHRSHLPHVWPDRRSRGAETLFLADVENDEILLYNPKTPNPSPQGSITDGIDRPIGVAVDKHGALYVVNQDNNTLTVYPHGKTSPSLTIDNGLDGPYGVAVDSHGDVFASNLNSATVVGYKPGATTPFETMNFINLGQPVGVGVDGKDNIWVACDTTSEVFEIPAGTSSPINSGLTGLNGPIGISFGPKDVIYVSSFSSQRVNVYKYGATSPFLTITNGIEASGPTLNAVTARGAFFQTNQFLNVVGYKKGQSSPFSTITGNPNPVGIAVTPLVKK
jgi:hypothetical protein